MDFNDTYKPFEPECGPGYPGNFSNCIEHNHNKPDCDPCSPCQHPMEPIAPMRPIQPVPPIPENMTLIEQMNLLRRRQNECIKQWNEISKNCYDALNQIVEGARANDVYYSDCEVKYEKGYSEDEGCEYSLVIKRVVDHCGKPIRVRLALAFDNTTNSGVKQSIFDTSFIKSANVIISAVNYNADNWNGPAMQGGEPIAYTSNADGWVYGFNRAGVLRVFKGDVTTATLCQNGMVDVIGNCVPVVVNDAVTTEAEQMVQKGSIMAIGYNQGTGSVMFFACSNQNQTGMTGISVAKLLQNRGCNTAVITSIETDVGGSSAAGMLYMGQMTVAPTGNNVPQNLAYWIVSKQENFCNDFQKEVSDLVQVSGRNMWETYLLGQKVLEFDGRITANEEAINKEIKDRIDGDNALDQKITAETERATSEEEKLNTKIENETERATSEEQRLDQKIDAETQRATAAENENAQNINAEKLRAIARENEIQASIDKEIRERISADNDIINSIEQEILARRAADTEITTLIEQEVARAKGQETLLQTQIEGIVSGTTNLPFLKLIGGTLTGPVAIEGANNTLTVGRGPISSLEVATKKYVDDAIAGGTTPGGDVTKEYVDQQIGTVLDGLNGKLSTSGGTMTGPINISYTPSANTDAVPKSYVDAKTKEVSDKIDEIADGSTELPYVKKTGDTMTGDLTMDGNAVIKFNTDGSVYNDDTAVVLQSENNGVKLIGTSVKVNSPAGNAVKINGVAPGSVAGDAIEYSQLEDIKSGSTPLPYVKKTGDTMTGALAFDASVTAPMISDTSLGENEQNVVEFSHANGGVILNSRPDGGSIKFKTVNGNVGVTAVSDSTDIKETGETGIVMKSGEMSVNNRIIHDLVEPVEDNDAATKKYVDDRSTSGSVPSQITEIPNEVKTILNTNTLYGIYLTESELNLPNLSGSDARISFDYDNNVMYAFSGSGTALHIATFNPINKTYGTVRNFNTGSSGRGKGICRINGKTYFLVGSNNANRYTALIDLETWTMTDITWSGVGYQSSIDNTLIYKDITIGKDSTAYILKYELNGTELKTSYYTPDMYNTEYATIYNDYMYASCKKGNNYFVRRVNLNDGSFENIFTVAYINSNYKLLTSDSKILIYNELLSYSVTSNTLYFSGNPEIVFGTQIGVIGPIVENNTLTFFNNTDSKNFAYGVIQL